MKILTFLLLSLSLVTCSSRGEGSGIDRESSNIQATINLRTAETTTELFAILDNNAEAPNDIARKDFLLAPQTSPPSATGRFY